MPTPNTPTAYCGKASDAAYVPTAVFRLVRLSQKRLSIFDGSWAGELHVVESLDLGAEQRFDADA